MRKGQETVVERAREHGLPDDLVEFLADSEAEITTLKQAEYFFEGHIKEKSSGTLLAEAKAVIENIPDVSAYEREERLRTLLPARKEYPQTDAKKKAWFAAIKAGNNYVALDKWCLSYALSAAGLKDDEKILKEVAKRPGSRFCELVDALKWESIIKDYKKDPEQSIILGYIYNNNKDVLYSGRIAKWLAEYPDLKDIFPVKAIIDPLFDADIYYKDKNPFIPVIAEEFPMITGGFRERCYGLNKSWKAKKLLNSCEYILENAGENASDVAEHMKMSEHSYDCVVSYKNGDIRASLREADKTGVRIRQGKPELKQLKPVKLYMIRAAKDGNIYIKIPGKKEKTTNDLNIVPTSTGNDAWDKFVCVLSGKEYDERETYILKEEQKENPLQKIARLPDNWNGEGAEKFSNSLIWKCTVILDGILFVPEIFPTGRGSIQFEFDKEDGSYLEFEVYEDKTTCLLVPEGNYDMAKEWDLGHNSEIPGIVNKFFGVSGIGEDDYIRRRAI